MNRLRGGRRVNAHLGPFEGRHSVTGDLWELYIL